MPCNSIPGHHFFSVTFPMKSIVLMNGDNLASEPAKLIAMHAGLECGVIGDKYPSMQMVSFGPTIVDPHSPNERVQISSVESFWNYLKLVLENL